jgi:hypothetical protein
MPISKRVTEDRAAHKTTCVILTSLSPSHRQRQLVRGGHYWVGAGGDFVHIATSQQQMLASLSGIWPQQARTKELATSRRLVF